MVRIASVLTILAVFPLFSSAAIRTINIAVEPVVTHEYNYDDMMGMTMIADSAKVTIPEFTIAAGETVEFNITFNGTAIFVDSDVLNSLNASMDIYFNAACQSLSSGGWGGDSDLSISIELTEPVNIPATFDGASTSVMKTTSDGTDDYYIKSSVNAPTSSIGTQPGQTSFSGAKITVTAPTYFFRYLDSQTFTLGSQTYRDNEFKVDASSYVMEQVPDAVMLMTEIQCTSPVGDLDGDCKVGLGDLALFAGNWMVDCENDPGNTACQ